MARKDNRPADLAASVRIVLVNPMYGGNIGSCIRAMANMGGRDLVLVSPRVGLDDDETNKMAAGARKYIDETRVVSTLREALADINFAVAATARVGGRRRPFTDPRGAAKMLSQLEEGIKTAIVFGPEDAGLSNDDLFLCHAFARIPSHPRMPSLNLAQAVMVFLYELRMAGALPPPPGTAKSYPPATVGETEEFFDHLEDTLWELEFLQPQDPDRILFSMRRLFSRIPRLEKREVKMLRGILAHAMRAARAADMPSEDFAKAYKKRLSERKKRLATDAGPDEKTDS